MSEESKSSTHNKWDQLATDTETSTAEVATEQAAISAETLSQWQANCERLQAELDVHKSKLVETEKQILYWRAEMQTTKRIAAEDVLKAEKFALKNMANELLPVVDNLERALAAEQQTSHSLYEGVELTRKLLLGVFEKFGIEAIAPQPGDVFDPESHEAMATQPAEGQVSRSIVQVLQKGYRLHGRLLRAAMVIIAA